MKDPISWQEKVTIENSDQRKVMSRNYEHKTIAKSRNLLNGEHNHPEGVQIFTFDQTGREIKIR